MVRIRADGDRLTDPYAHGGERLFRRYEAVVLIRIAGAAVRGHHPDPPLCIFRQTADSQPRNAVLGRETAETVGIVAVEPLFCPDPEESAGIAVNGAHLVADQPVRRGQIVEGHQFLRACGCADTEKNRQKEAEQWFSHKTDGDSSYKDKENADMTVSFVHRGRHKSSLITKQPLIRNKCAPYRP